ncbi:hypothetical protein THAOC_36427 [Thalassiosira oceanica]|uniref:Uncharacterized protein n=1 Tax=Thalassiosira oceanica TaxID=159749 RepID=K0QZE3_THAOC|nr:hypothetical protein THAOC_36427 [Thalassiosira oceanica]|eukprot:EJK44993.1 hypothetical protein THAOC_36427 [Thalassiosira oceanica]
MGGEGKGGSGVCPGTEGKRHRGLADCRLIEAAARCPLTEGLGEQRRFTATQQTLLARGGVPSSGPSADPPSDRRAPARARRGSARTRAPVPHGRRRRPGEGGGADLGQGVGEEGGTPSSEEEGSSMGEDRSRDPGRRRRRWRGAEGMDSAAGRPGGRHPVPGRGPSSPPRFGATPESVLVRKDCGRRRNRGDDIADPGGLRARLTKIRTTQTFRRETDATINSPKRNEIEHRTCGGRERYRRTDEPQEDWGRRAGEDSDRGSDVALAGLTEDAFTTRRRGERTAAVGESAVSARIRIRAVSRTRLAVIFLSASSNPRRLSRVAIKSSSTSAPALQRGPAATSPSSIFSGRGERRARDPGLRSGPGTRQTSGDRASASVRGRLGRVQDDEGADGHVVRRTRATNDAGRTAVSKEEYRVPAQRPGRGTPPVGARAVPGGQEDTSSSGATPPPPAVKIEWVRLRSIAGGKAAHDADGRRMGLSPSIRRGRLRKMDTDVASSAYLGFDGRGENEKRGHGCDNQCFRTRRRWTVDVRRNGASPGEGRRLPLPGEDDGQRRGSFRGALVWKAAGAPRALKATGDGEEEDGEKEDGETAERKPEEIALLVALCSAV